MLSVSQSVWNSTGTVGSILISFTHLCVGLPYAFCLSFFFYITLPNPVWIIFLPPVCHMPSLSHLPWFITQIIFCWAVQSQKLCIVHFSPVSCYFLCLNREYVSQHPHLERAVSAFFPLCERTGSGPFKTSGRITVLYVLACVSVCSRR